MKIDAAYQRYLAALECRLEGGMTAEGLAQNWTDTRAAMADHFEAYLRGDIPQVEPEIAKMVLIALREAQEGHSPELFTLPTKTGRRSEPLAVLKCKEAAVRYIRMVRAGVGDDFTVDRAPIKTVMTAFKVSRDAVERWLNEPNLSSDPLPDPLTESHLQEAAGLMRACGLQYGPKGGAGHEAVRTRSRKCRTK